jgi:predicted O-methyltransferase YrrM
MFMNSIPSIIIDSTNALTELCYMGKLARTDKTPYNEHGHRHPYTAVYSLLFGSLRYRECKFAEIGVAGGASVVLWNNYFKKAMFYFFDRDTDFLKNASNYVPEEKNSFTEMDVSIASSIVKGLQETGGELDVLLDDSTHTREDQILIIKEGLPFVKSGGMIIIEDVYRNASEEYYLNELKDLLDQFSQVFFITTDHALRYSPGWDNDKLLVLIKK